VPINPKKEDETFRIFIAMVIVLFLFVLES